MKLRRILPLAVGTLVVVGVGAYVLHGEQQKDQMQKRGRAFQGFPIPNVSLAKGSIDLVTKVKLRMLQSAVDTVAAWMAIRTSLSLGAGLAISLNWRRSDAPYCECRIAFTGPSML